jgi:hypothetical protein
MLRLYHSILTQVRTPGGDSWGLARLKSIQLRTHHWSFEKNNMLTLVEDSRRDIGSGRWRSTQVRLGHSTETQIRKVRWGHTTLTKAGTEQLLPHVRDSY